MGRKSSRSDEGDKEWARKYILDPLTAPEPSQETGLGSSHYSALKNRTLPTNSHKGKQPASASPTIDVISASNKNTKTRHHQSTPSSKHSTSSRQSNYPTPPTSASPTRSNFHPSNPFSQSGNSEEAISPPRSPPSHPPSSSRRYPASSFISRSSSARVPPPSKSQTESRHSRSVSADHYGIARNNNNLLQRYPGDMSHRPLDVIKKETRTANHAPHLRRKNMPFTDTIDALDTIGGTYHHGGPYDATLASRNVNAKYPPVAAVQDSNMEAIRATPRENIQDSLERHMPLQGTAAIPSGAPDMSGNILNYEEGADLMRESDAAGGAYKRWDGINYHPDDLKGKGEPSYTYERDLKEHKRHRRGDPVEYEMVSNVNGDAKRTGSSHHRSVSNEGAGSSRAYVNSSSDLRRNNTTGKRLSDGLKRRFGSIRRKMASEEVY